MMNQACNDGSNLAHFSMNIGFPWFLDLKQTYKSNFKVNIKQTIPWFLGLKQTYKSNFKVNIKQTN